MKELTPELFRARWDIENSIKADNANAAKEHAIKLKYTRLREIEEKREIMQAKKDDLL